MRHGKEHVERSHYQLDNVGGWSLILLRTWLPMRKEAPAFLDIDKVRSQSQNDPSRKKGRCGQAEVVQLYTEMAKGRECTKSTNNIC